MEIYTRFAKKINNISKEEAIEIVKEYLENKIKTLEYAKSIDDDDEFIFLAYFGENNEVTQNKYIKNVKKALTDLINNKMKENDFHSFITYILDVDVYIEGKGCFANPNDELPYGIFKGGGYNDYLFSLEETANFLKDRKIIEQMNPNDRVYWELFGKKKVYEFWENNPDGLIWFG